MYDMGSVYPVYRTRSSVAIPAMACAGAGLLKLAARDRKTAFIVRVMRTRNRRKILKGRQHMGDGELTKNADRDVQEL